MHGLGKVKCADDFKSKKESEKMVDRKEVMGDMEGSGGAWRDMCEIMHLYTVE